ncbi:hypothetical protein CEXT_459891 [Caerostris extrusa]|uniref:Uncharacterized protein n=1 Tax=Caerostris extrusa TaxID=172846 RepID=A0AAV4X659_CAEEX|nr:hypothetical protein CEXT_459891 [Caerostris extrusa]
MAVGGRPWRNLPPGSVQCFGSYRSSWDTFLDGDDVKKGEDKTAFPLRYCNIVANPSLSSYQIDQEKIQKQTQNNANILNGYD